MNKIRYVYKFTNTITNKIYIGQTRQTLNKRRRCHIDKANQKEGWKSDLHKDIIKYGQDKFVIKLLEECGEDEVDEIESKWIKELNSLEPNGYNLQSGGKNSKLSDLIKKRMSGKIVSDKTKQKISSSHKGKNITSSQKRGLDTGRNLRWTEERKIEGSGSGNPNSILTEAKVSEIRNLWANRKTKKITQNELADLYGVTQMTISAIVTRKIWKHVA